MYYVWALFPLALLLFALWSAFSNWFGKRKKENPRYFSSQLWFCVLVYFISVTIDRHLILPQQEPGAVLDGIDSQAINVVRWLLYPALLTLGVTLFPNKRP